MRSLFGPMLVMATVVLACPGHWALGEAKPGPSLKVFVYSKRPQHVLHGATVSIADAYPGSEGKPWRQASTSTDRSGVASFGPDTFKYWDVYNDGGAHVRYNGQNPYDWEAIPGRIVQVNRGPDGERVIRSRAKPAVFRVRVAVSIDGYEGAERTVEFSEPNAEATFYLDDARRREREATESAPPAPEPTRTLPPAPPAPVDVPPPVPPAPAVADQQAQPGAGNGMSESTSATIQSIDVEHNYNEPAPPGVIVIGARPGMLIKIRFGVHALSNGTGRVCCYVLDGNGQGVRSAMPAYAAADGNLTVQADFRADGGDASFPEFKLFLPYVAFPAIAGRTDYRLLVDVRAGSAGSADVARVLASNSGYTFSMTPNR